MEPATSKQLEQKLLSILVDDPSRVFDVDGVWINAEDFKTRTIRCVYSALVGLASKDEDTLDPLLLESAVAEKYKPFYRRKARAIKRVIDLAFERRGSGDHVKFAQLVVNHAVKGRALTHLKDLRDVVMDSSDYGELISEMQQRTAEFSAKQLRVNDIARIGESFSSWLQERRDRVKNDKPLGIASGFEEYDDAIGGGFRRGTVNIVAARPKTGKSFFALNMSYNVALQGIPVLYLDTELQQDGQMDRLLSIMSRVPIRRLETGNFLKSKKQKGRVKEARNELRDLPLDYVEIRGWSIKKQIAYIRSWFARSVGKGEDGLYKPALVVLDYLKVMDLSDRRGNMAEWEALGHHMTALHDLMGDLRSPLFTMVQQNRVGIDDDHEGTISGSDRLLWFCDSLGILAKRKPEQLKAAYENIDIDQEGDPYNMLLKVRASRWGAGNEGDEYITIYSDINNPEMKKSKKTGVLTEVGLSRVRRQRKYSRD